MRRTQITLAAAVTIGILAAATGFGGSEPAAGDAASATKVAEYGISLALNGKLDEAETAFLSQLSLSPNDPGALNNIGNLYFLRGDIDVAMLFYGRARDIDSLDAGIVLNRSVAFLAAGDAVAAEREAARGVSLAGGLDSAQALLALKTDTGVERAAEGAKLSKASIRSLLQVASKKVPQVEAKPESLNASASPNDKGKRPETWRSAGPRGEEAVSVAGSLYWRR